MKRISLIAFFAIALAASAASGRQSDSTESTLASAKASYAAAVESVREKAEAAFAAAEERARGKADSKRLGELASARKAFEAWQDLPEEQAFEAARTKLAQARKALTDAHLKAVKEYGKAKEVEKADAVVKSLNQLQEGWDALKVGSVWTGTLKWAVQGGNKVESSGFTMTVADRQGGAVTMKVKWSVNGQDKLATIDGQVESGRFTGHDKAKTMSVSGKVVGDRLNLTVGRAASGSVKALTAVAEVRVNNR